MNTLSHTPTSHKSTPHHLNILVIKSIPFGKTRYPLSLVYIIPHINYVHQLSRALIIPSRLQFIKCILFNMIITIIWIRVFIFGPPLKPQPEPPQLCIAWIHFVVLLCRFVYIHFVCTMYIVCTHHSQWMLSSWQRFPRDHLCLPLFLSKNCTETSTLNSIKSLIFNWMLIVNRIDACIRIFTICHLLARNVCCLCMLLDEKFLHIYTDRRAHSLTHVSEHLFRDRQ